MRKKAYSKAKNDVSNPIIFAKLSFASLWIAVELLLCVPLWNKQSVILEFKKMLLSFRA